MHSADISSLLDDAGFVAQLEQFDHESAPGLEEPHLSEGQLDDIDRAAGRPTGVRKARPANPPAPPFDAQARQRAHDALERSLEPEYYEQHHHHLRTETRHPARVPEAVAALVMVLGFVTGACTAAIVFHDRLVQVAVQLSRR